MIYCPKCGTANRDGSRFCNECGQRLGAQTRVRCPHCGAFNSIQNVFCDDCGGPLLPARGDPAASDATVQIKGLSLPTKGPVPTGAQGESDDVPGEDADVPGWLRELGSSWASQGPAEPAAGEGAEIPDWLKDLRESLPDEAEVGASSAEEGEVPGWLASMQPSAPAEEEAPDWLAELRGEGAGQEPARPMPAAAEPPAVEVPDWLAGMSADSGQEPTEQETARAIDEQVPDWLAELPGSEIGTEPERPVPAAPELPPADVPDWLAELRGSGIGTEPAGPAPAEPELPAADVPDWLAGLHPGPVEAPQAAEAAPAIDAGGELPDWLAELRAPAQPEPPPAPEPGPPVEPSVPAEEAAVPDWLSALRPPAGSEPPVEPPPFTPSRRREEAAAAQMPAWLAELRPSGIEEPVPAEPGLEVEPDAGEQELDAEALLGEVPVGEVPDWLVDLRASGGEAEATTPESKLIPDYPGDDLAAGEIPEWLVASEGGREEETLARAEIPEWLLALKPRALRAEGEPEAPSIAIEEPVEETGILAGLQGTLPVEVVIAQPRVLKALPVVEAPVVDTPHARIFAEIVGRPIATAPKALAQPRRRMLSLLPRWLLYIALIAAVAFPLFLGESLISREAEESPAVRALFDRVAGLDENSVVLVAFDYDPTASGEMDVLARSLVGAVMDRGARVIAVSTLPAGPATAQRVLDDLVAERPLYADRYGERYANLGYISGQVAGVRLLSRSLPLALVHDFYTTPLADLPVLDGIVSAADLDLVLELAATQDTLRWWVEQAGAPYSIPIAAGTSGAVEPFARAYYQAEPPQLVGLAAGVPGAVSYDALAGGEAADRLAARLDSQLGGHLVFIVVLLVGAVLGWLRRDTGREV